MYKEGLGQFDEAAAALESGREFYLQSGQEYLAQECTASLALLALARGDVARAGTHAEGLVVSLTGQPLQGLEPFRLYLAVYRALHAAQDRRAGQVLEAASRQQPAQRHSFIQAPVSPSLLEAWENLSPL